MVTKATRPDGLSAANAARALALACAAAELDATGARLVRLGENAIYEVPRERIVVRIARSEALAGRVRRELDVARWLGTQGFPAARVAERLTQPCQVDGRLVTFWEQILPDPGGEATFEDLATILRELHRLPSPPFDLPAFDPFSVVPARLAEAGDISHTDLIFLTNLHERLREQYASLTFPTPFGLIHGDAHRGNLLRVSGKPILLDFEVVAHGPREWDLTSTAMSVDRFGVSVSSYESFASTYGRDVTDWPGYRVLREIRELTMTTWLMQLVGEGSQYADEFRLRVESLREGDHARRWHAF